MVKWLIKNPGEPYLPLAPIRLAAHRLAYPGASWGCPALLQDPGVDLLLPMLKEFLDSDQTHPTHPRSPVLGGPHVTGCPVLRVLQVVLDKGLL